MEVTAELAGEAKKLKVKGRLDGYWADHLATALEAEIQRGSHRLLLDLSEVDFLSSAGIRVLVRYYKQLKEIDGALMISEASQPVTKVLEISKLATILLGGKNPEEAPHGEAAAPARHLEMQGAAVEVFPCVTDATLECRLIGDPVLQPGRRFSAEGCRTLQFPESSFGFGLGALGDSYEDCRGRFGEFLTARGAVAYTPTDGTNVPDYLVPAGSTLPEVQVCYGVVCLGEFARLARFEANTGLGAVTLTQVAEAALELAEWEQVGLLLAAETAGLVGAALRRAPEAQGSGNRQFEYPQVREWLSFTSEPAYTHSLALVAGVAVRGDAGLLAPLLRPLQSASSILGHFHAAAFTYRPMQKRDIEVNRTVRSLFEDQTLQGVLHLLSDDRGITGAGQSRFVRGALWLSPLRGVIEARS